MGRNLRFWLAAPNATPFDPSDAPLALGALLLRAAQTDHAALFARPGALAAILAHCYDLTAREAAEMLEACDRVEAVAPPGCDFARLLHKAICNTDRRAMARRLCEALVAGGYCGPGDPRIATLIEAVLGIEDHDSAASRRAS
ncbi:hypothetical protein Q4543_00205 [Salipiger sp. 1_MG-2023]|uniref:hypothetical protein n=1 Tax=Salipiger sp. 1_MG-2023 TaxID=3062665 RepID=UPI0026E426A9|nr:hypothetical protein [Salipiger sp. 1_MG-2023]MDO6583929.1 hypothetical protein [Salipiger sp. 1_MG-2023]